VDLFQMQLKIFQMFVQYDRQDYSKKDSILFKKKYSTHPIPITSLTAFPKAAAIENFIQYLFLS